MRSKPEQYAFTVPPTVAARVEEAAKVLTALIVLGGWFVVCVAITHMVAKGMGIV